MEDPSALKKFFDLMLNVLRVVNAVILSRGMNNDQSIKFARDFLNENRTSIVAVFKRHAAVGGLKVESGNEGVEIDLGDLVDHFTLLISGVGWVEVGYFSLLLFYLMGRVVR
jgi:nuclear pore complex protein Nup205